MAALGFELLPGVLISLAAKPEWGVGQIQSCIGSIVTANFSDAGKQVLNTLHCEIDIVNQA